MDEKQALLDLQSDMSVLTRPADKGGSVVQSNTSVLTRPADNSGSVVLMDRTVYVNECHRQLLDKPFTRNSEVIPLPNFRTLSLLS